LRISLEKGFFVHCRFLLEALLVQYPDFGVEIWTYSFNLYEVKKAFGAIILNNPDRVFIYDESRFLKINSNQIYRIPVKKKVKILAHSILYLLFRSDRFKRGIINNSRKKFIPNVRLFENALLNAYKSCSKAKVIYLPGAVFRVAEKLRLPKVIAVHDLFTVSHRDLFIKDSKWIDMHNTIVISNLKAFARQNSVFVSSTEYIARYHTYRFVPGVRRNQIRVIPFPPLIKRLSDLEDGTASDIKTKQHSIESEYIFYPTQIRPNKNVITLVKALEYLFIKYHLDLKLVTTGRIKDSAELSSYVEKNNLQRTVIEVGTLSDQELAAYYAHSRIVVIPSIIEGMGISGQCLEALYMGNIPIVHAISDGIDESLASVGLDRYSADLNWFLYNDYQQCAEQIYTAYTEREKTIKKQAGIIGHYLALNWTEVAKKYYELFEELAAYN